MTQYEELHNQLMYNPWTGNFYWKIDKANGKVKAGEQCVNWAGCDDNSPAF